MKLVPGARTSVAIIESPGGVLQVKQSTGHETVSGEYVGYNYHFHPHFDIGRYPNGSQVDVLVQHVRRTEEKDSAGRSVCIVDIHLPAPV